MKGWHLPTLLDDLHKSVETELGRARQTLGHPTEKGDASELVWIELFEKYLPHRYRACKAHVVDSNGVFSEQIDVVIHDRQYSPLVFHFKDSLVVPAESVYAVFEAKQEMTADHITYAQKKVASVRGLHRTSLPVPTIDGTRPPKQPAWIIGGILTLACVWMPPLGETIVQHLGSDLGSGRLDVGCIADAGWFAWDGKKFDMHCESRAATRFLFELIARLQEMATAPMIDIRAYGKHIP